MSKDQLDINKFKDVDIQKLHSSSDNNNNFDNIKENDCINLYSKYITTKKNLSIESCVILSKFLNDKNSIPKEAEEGNIEYKRKLIPKDHNRLEHLATQLKWRLDEGHGIAIYALGVENNGEIKGILLEELNASLECLKKLAKMSNSTVENIHRIEINKDKYACEVIIKSNYTECEVSNVRVALLGDTGSGKSTLVGVLLHGELDDCNGKARSGLLKHPHEMVTGKTSSIYQEIIGFDSNKHLINFSSCSSITDIIKSSKMLMTLIDLAGFHRFIKTTINGLFFYNPHLVIINISSDTSLSLTTKEHLYLALLLELDIIIVINKIDLLKNHYDRIINSISELLENVNSKRVPFISENNNEDEETWKKFKINNSNKIPIIPISCVTGFNLSKLLGILSNINENAYKQLPYQTKLPCCNVKFEIVSYYLSECDTIILCGFLKHGTIAVENQLILGPFVDESFKETTIKTIRKNNHPVLRSSSGHIISIGISVDNINNQLSHIRRGMILTSSNNQPNLYWFFNAELLLLYHPKYIAPNFQAQAHIGSVVQTVTVIKIENEDAVLKPGTKAVVRLKFLLRPEHICNGSMILLRNGRTNAVGFINSF